MQRQRDGLIPVAEVLSGMGVPVPAIRETPPPARRGFTLADQVNQLVGASEADADRGFMARTMALCSLPRVLTRFVLKYTLRAQAEPSGAHEAVEGGTGHARDLGDGGLGNAQFEEAPDIVLLAIEP